jgi:hypothetical protein
MVPSTVLRFIHEASTALIGTSQMWRAVEVANNCSVFEAHRRTVHLLTCHNDNTICSHKYNREDAKVFYAFSISSQCSRMIVLQSSSASFLYSLRFVRSRKKAIVYIITSSIVITDHVTALSEDGLEKFGSEPSGFGSKGILERSTPGGSSIDILMLTDRSYDRKRAADGSWSFRNVTRRKQI